MSDRNKDTGPISLVVEQSMGVEETEGRPPESTLARLIDLEGSVALSRFFEEIDIDVPEVEATTPDAVQQGMESALAVIRGRLNTAFENAFKPRYRLPSAGRASSILKRGGVFDLTTAELNRKRTPAPIRAATRTLWAPFGEFLETQQKRARFALGELRTELTHPIIGLGLQSARLERADSALREATRGAVEDLYKRLGPAIEQDFIKALTAQLILLSPPVSEEDFEAHFGAEGWLGDFFDRSRSMIVAVLDHEEQMLRNLVEAACALVPDNDGSTPR